MNFLVFHTIIPSLSSSSSSLYMHGLFNLNPWLQNSWVDSFLIQKNIAPCTPNSHSLQGPIWILSTLALLCNWSPPPAKYRFPQTKNPARAAPIQWFTPRSSLMVNHISDSYDFVSHSSTSGVFPWSSCGMFNHGAHCRGLLVKISVYMLISSSVLDFE